MTDDGIEAHTGLYGLFLLWDGAKVSAILLVGQAARLI